MRKAFAIISILFVASVVMQLYFAAVGVFSNAEDELFLIHGENGRIVVRALALLTLVFAALARAGKRTIWLSVLALVLVLFQTVFFILVGVIWGLGPPEPGVPEPDIPTGATILLGFHGLNGAAIIALSIVLAKRATHLAFPKRAATPSLEDAAPPTGR